MVEPSLFALAVWFERREGWEADRCTCTRERVAGFLDQFAGAEIDDLREEDGTIVVTCEFCSTRYEFEDGRQK